jgi:hypothetical protein
LAGGLAAAGRSADALTIASRASHGDERTTALSAVMDHVDEATRAGILTQALEDCATTIDFFRSSALHPLLRWLDAAGVQAAHSQLAAPLANPIARGWCEAMLVERLLELGAIEAAHALAVAITDPQSRAEALSQLVAKLSEPQRTAAVEFVLATSQTLDDARWREEVTQAFGDLPEPLPAIVPVMFAGRGWRAEALCTIEPHLTGDQAQRAAALLHAITEQAVGETDMVSRVRAVAALPAALRTGLLDMALQTATSVVIPADRSSALEALAPVLEARHVDAVLAAVTGLENLSDRITLVAALVPLLDARTLPVARALVETIGDEDDLVLAGAACAAAADPAARHALLDAAARRGAYVRARAVALLVPALDAGEWAHAQALLDSIDDPGSLAEVALPAFARRGAGTQRDVWLRQAIDAAASMTDPERRAWAFQAFRDLLTPQQIDDALAAFERTEARMDDEWRSFGRALLLALALPRVPAERFDAVHDEVLSLVVALPEPDLRRSVLVDLVEAGPRVRFDRVVEIVEHECDPYERAMMAGFLIEATPAALRPRLVAAALREVDRIEGDGFESKASRTEGGGGARSAVSRRPGGGVAHRADLRR